MHVYLTANFYKVGKNNVSTPKIIHQKGMHLNHDFYVVVCKQIRTENAYDGSPIQYFCIN